MRLSIRRSTASTYVRGGLSVFREGWFAERWKDEGVAGEIEVVGRQLLQINALQELPRAKVLGPDDDPRSSRSRTMGRTVSPGPT